MRLSLPLIKQLKHEKVKYAVFAGSIFVLVCGFLSGHQLLYPEILFYINILALLGVAIIGFPALIFLLVTEIRKKDLKQAFITSAILTISAICIAIFRSFGIGEFIFAGGY